MESIRADGLSSRRFRDATVVKVPKQFLNEFRDFNRKMCQADELCPAFSADMAYALLTRRSISRRRSHVHRYVRTYARTHAQVPACVPPTKTYVNAVRVHVRNHVHRHLCT